MRFNCVRLLVSDFKACFRFYSQVLGFEPSIGDENDDFAAFLTEGGFELSIFRKDLMAGVVGTSSLPANAQAQDGSVIIFQVESVDKMAEKLRSKGVKLASEPTDRPEWGLRTAHFRDPDGNLFEIFQGLRKTSS